MLGKELGAGDGLGLVVAAAAGAVAGSPPFPSTNLAPIERSSGLEIPLSCISRLTLTPSRSAICESVSPGRTTTTFALPVRVRLAVARRLDEAPVAPPSTRRAPACTESALVRPLSCINRDTLTPSRSAISERVSPG